MTKITADDWSTIKARYELGHKVREIAADYDYDNSNLVRKAKKEGWIHGRIQQPIATAAKLITDVTANLPQKEIDAVKKELDDRLAILGSIANLQKGALNLHGIIIKKTIEQAQAGEVTAKDASQVLANVGLKVDQIHKAYTPAEQSPHTAVQINNSNHIEKPVVINFNPVKKLNE